MIGLTGRMVDVEVSSMNGEPRFNLVGLPDAAIKESGERVRAAMKNSGYNFPYGRITVNLAPADLRKAGPSYDLPIALGLLLATRQLPPNALDDVMIVGELGLVPMSRRGSGEYSGDRRIGPASKIQSCSRL